MKSKAAARNEKSAFVRGLLAATIILYFSQFWTWYEKSDRYIEQSFDMINEIDFNKNFLMLVESEGKTMNALANGNKASLAVPAGVL